MSKRPNIILMLTDDLGIGDVSCFNPDSKIRTENIDALASQGMKMTDCHSSSAVCTPSRYALLTGRYNWRSRMKSRVLSGQAPALIEEGRETIASLLKKQGYRTACVGKWHLGMDWATNGDYTAPDFSNENDWSGLDYSKPIKNGPNTRGFDYFYGMSASLDQPPFVFIENDHVLKAPDRMIGIKNLKRMAPGTPCDVEFGPAAPDFDPVKVVPEMDERVLSLVDEYAETSDPFFIYYPTPAVHGPLVPSEEYKGKSSIGLYGDFVLQVDGFVGRLMKKLKDKEIENNTIVIFTSDNGCSAIVDYLQLEKMGHHPSYLYRGNKGDIWDGGHRIPFIIRWPGEIKPGSVSDQTACLVDIFAALAEITGASYGDDAGEDSVSCLPLWKGEERPLREATIHHSILGNYAVRKGKWKLVLCPGSGSYPSGEDTGGLPPIQLYDMEADVGERRNLYFDYPEIVSELKAIARDYILNGRSTPGAPQKNYQSDNWPGLEWMKD